MVSPEQGTCCFAEDRFLMRGSTLKESSGPLLRKVQGKLRIQEFTFNASRYPPLILQGPSQGAVFGIADLSFSRT